MVQLKSTVGFCWIICVLKKKNLRRFFKKKKNGFKRIEIGLTRRPEKLSALLIDTVVIMSMNAETLVSMCWVQSFIISLFFFSFWLAQKKPKNRSKVHPLALTLRIVGQSFAAKKQTKTKKSTNGFAGDGGRFEKLSALIAEIVLIISATTEEQRLVCCISVWHLNSDGEEAFGGKRKWTEKKRANRRLWVIEKWKTERNRWKGKTQSRWAYENEMRVMKTTKASKTNKSKKTKKTKRKNQTN